MAIRTVRLRAPHGVEHVEVAVAGPPQRVSNSFELPGLSADRRILSTSATTSQTRGRSCQIYFRARRRAVCWTQGRSEQRIAPSIARSPGAMRLHDQFAPMAYSSSGSGSSSAGSCRSLDEGGNIRSNSTLKASAGFFPAPIAKSLPSGLWISMMHGGSGSSTKSA